MNWKQPPFVQPQSAAPPEKQPFPIAFYVLMGAVFCVVAASSDRWFIRLMAAAMAFYYGSDVGILIERRKK
jgi:hypothetical protein